MKLFVWEDALSDYTDGLVCVLARNEAEAWEKLYEKDKSAWWTLNGEERVEDGGRDYSISLHTKLSSLNRSWGDRAKHPKVVSTSTAFVVWGGGG